jgi:hypothetical protein
MTWESCMWNTRPAWRPARIRKGGKGMKKSWIALLIAVGAVMVLIVGVIVYARILIGAPII